MINASNYIFYLIMFYIVELYFYLITINTIELYFLFDYV